MRQGAGHIESVALSSVRREKQPARDAVAARTSASTVSVAAGGIRSLRWEGVMTLTDVLTMSPDEIQAWLDQQLASAPPEIQAVIEQVDYVEPGSVRDLACSCYVMLGDYEGDREKVEIAFKVKPGMEPMLSLIFKLL